MQTVKQALAAFWTFSIILVCAALTSCDPGYTLRGAVTAQSGGSAIAGATVTVTDASGAIHSTTTDASGRYWIGRLAAGSAEVTATAPGYTRATRQITINRHMTLGIALERTAPGCRLGFDGLSSNGAAFSSYTACGYTVTATTPNWTVRTNYGQPAPFIQFATPGGTTATGEVIVTASGAPFRFSSVDLYSSTTPIPYVITGIAGSETVFTIQNTQPNTFGNFATIVNPESAKEIDTLVIRLSNPAAPCCSNPMGLDNIVLSPPAPGTTDARVIVAGTPPALGTSSQFTAIAVMPDGSNQNVTSQAAWHSSNRSVATVTSSGMVTAASAGSVEISATYANMTGKFRFTAAAFAGYTLRGGVTDAQPDGSAIAGATVTVTDASGVIRSTMTDASGQYSIGGLAVGSAEVTATAPGYIRATEQITISGDMTLGIALERTALCPQIGFDELSPHGAAFSSYTACGYTVTATTPNWTVRTNYGQPAPFIQFATLGGTTATGEVIVTASGAPFRFSSVDLYSSTTPIPYVITGIAGSETVFTIQNTQPNTFGNFATIVNPESAKVIDRLVIRLSNPAAPCCSNPVGLDNILLATP